MDLIILLDKHDFVVLEIKVHIGQSKDLIYMCSTKLKQKLFKFS